MSIFEEGYDELAAFKTSQRRYAAIASEAREAGDDEPTVLWKVDVAIAAAVRGVRQDYLAFCQRQSSRYSQQELDQIDADAKDEFQLAIRRAYRWWLLRKCGLYFLLFPFAAILALIPTAVFTIALEATEIVNHGWVGPVFLGVWGFSILLLSAMPLEQYAKRVGAWIDRRRISERSVILILPFACAFLTLEPGGLQSFNHILGWFLFFLGCIASEMEAKRIPDQGWANVRKALLGATLLFVATVVVRAAAFKLVPVLSLVPANLNSNESKIIVAAYAGVPVLLTWWFWIRWRGTASNQRSVSAAGLIGGAAEAASRVKAILIGLWFAGIGFAFLWWSLPPLAARFPQHATDPSDWVLPFMGTAVGAYLFLARGLGPTWNALSWSSLSNDTHGRARTATARELREYSLIPRSSKAIYLGQFLENGWNQGEVGYLGGSPLITIGKPGSGKGTGLIVPNLSTLRRSILIIDPKGEAAAITARKRSEFGRVVVLNPFNYLADKMLWLASEGYNPLATIKTDKNFVSDCTVIGHALVKQEKDGAGRFFSTSAHDLVTALIMYEVLSKKKRGERPNLSNVWAMISAPWGNDETGPTGIARTIGEMATHEYAPLRSLTGRFMSTSKSNQDIISTAINEVSFINDPEMGEDISSTSSFRFADMKEEIVTVYLILPATHMESHANWLRVMIASALRELQGTLPGQGLPPVLFMLDEFANLGHLPAISNAMNMTRGYGVQLWPFVQDLNQLKYLYHDNWENFLGARAALTAFAPGDVFTSNYLAELCGHKTMIVESENEKADHTGMGRGRGPQGMPLIRPEEIRAMPPEQMLCFVDPVRRPFMVVAPGYWKTEFKEGLDDNPYYRA